MHCVCCDRLLNDYESTRKSRTTGEYLDTCNKCFRLIEDEIDTIDRTDLNEGEVVDWELGEDEWESCIMYDEDE